MYFWVLVRIFHDLSLPSALLSRNIHQLSDYRNCSGILIYFPELINSSCSYVLDLRNYTGGFLFFLLAYCPLNLLFLGNFIVECVSSPLFDIGNTFRTVQLPFSTIFFIYRLSRASIDYQNNQIFIE